MTIDIEVLFRNNIENVVDEQYSLTVSGPDFESYKYCSIFSHHCWKKWKRKT